MASEDRPFNLDRYKSLRRLDNSLNQLDGAIKDLHLRDSSDDDEDVEKTDATLDTTMETKNTGAETNSSTFEPSTRRGSMTTDGRGRFSFMRRGSLLQMAKGLGALEHEIDHICDEADAPSHVSKISHDSFYMSTNFDDLDDLQAELAMADQQYETLLDPSIVDDASVLTDDSSSYPLMRKLISPRGKIGRSRSPRRKKSRSPTRRNKSRSPARERIQSLDCSEKSGMSNFDSLHDIHEGEEHDEDVETRKLKKSTPTTQNDSLTMEVALLKENQARLQAVQDATRRDMEAKAASLSKQFQESQREKEGSLSRVRQERSALEKRLSFRLKKLASMDADQSEKLISEEAKRQELEQELEEVRSVSADITVQHANLLEEHKQEKEALETEVSKLKAKHNSEKHQLLQQAASLEVKVTNQKQVLMRLESEHQNELKEKQSE
mmetsp:Transcript_4363/g.10236  ORF Transcript_4363/g.10236 Transcript_4363/m.10236 type:complete len:438 (+) Transcript_4363:87-1400(+)